MQSRLFLPKLVGSTNTHRNDLIRILYRFATFDFVDVFHALDDPAPNSILSIQKVRIVKTDEELAVGTVGMICASHGDSSAFMWSLAEFTLQVFPRTASACSCWIPSLGHESIDD